MLFNASVANDVTGSGQDIYVLKINIIETPKKEKSNVDCDDVNLAVYF